MIKYNLRTPVDCENGNGVGVTGENLAFKEEFVINGLADSTLSFVIHLRFADGSVNSLIPDSVLVADNCTDIVWNVRKNDIFMHGYFELQLEGSNDSGLVFQTEIVNLYADESIPVEDGEYLNPNSETLKLRNEMFNIQKQISENAELIKESGVLNKADIADTLAGYGITDAYTKAETDGKINTKQEKLAFDTVPTLGSQNILTSDRIAAALSYKADSKDVAKKANKTDVESAIALKESSALKTSDIRSVTDATENYPSIDYLNNYYYNVAETDELLDAKCDKSDFETGQGVLEAYSTSADKVRSAVFNYEKVGNYCLIGIVIIMNECTITNYIHFTNMPFKHVSTDVSYNDIVYSDKMNTAKIAIGKNTTWMNIFRGINGHYDDGEVITANVIYKIA